MSEETNITMPSLETMLPIDVLFLYCASQLGEIACNTTNKTLTMTTPYTYDENTLLECKRNIEQQIESYKQQMTTEDIPHNDYELFTSCLNFISISIDILNIKED